jgi:hypothetical protein
MNKLVLLTVISPWELLQGSKSKDVLAHAISFLTSSLNWRYCSILRVTKHHFRWIESWMVAISCPDVSEKRNINCRLGYSNIFPSVLILNAIGLRSSSLSSWQLPHSRFFKNVVLSLAQTVREFRVTEWSVNYEYKGCRGLIDGTIQVYTWSGWENHKTSSNNKFQQSFFVFNPLIFI